MNNTIAYFIVHTKKRLDILSKK